MTPRPGMNWPPLPLVRDTTVTEAPVDRDRLTRRLTEAAVAWIEQQRDRPFFLYLPQCTPGSTEAPFVSPDFRGRSQNGSWGDAIEELDWSLGEVMQALERLGIADRTLVVWTSDNGAPRRDPRQGSNEPLAGWGYTTAEGGMRVPCIMHWPGVIPPGEVCDELATMMDLLPTFAAAADAPLPRDSLFHDPLSHGSLSSDSATYKRRRIDGRDITALLTRPGAASPHKAFYYYQLDELQAVRSGQWKLYVSRDGRAKRSGTPTAARLYDVVADPGESQDQASAQPQVVERLEALAVAMRDDIGDGDVPGKNTRPVGHVAEPRPLRLP
ncbi:MAG: sulfatase-like hydrolase/transferase [Pirellulales bacterium]